MSFPVMYSTLSDKALSDYISINYDIEEIIDCRLLLRGMNDTYGSPYLIPLEQLIKITFKDLKHLKA